MRAIRLESSISPTLIARSTLDVKRLDTPTPNETWAITASEAYDGTAGSGLAYVYLAPGRTELVNPAIVVEGFDLDNTMDWPVLYDLLNQENLIEQLKNGARAFHAPVNTLNANWAYMVMTSLAWTLKAWMGHSLPVAPRWRARHLAEKRRILTMEFRTFVNSFITMPCQIVRMSRQIVYRLLSWNPWQHVFLRLIERLHGRQLC